MNILYFSAPVRDAVGQIIRMMGEYSVYEEMPEEGKSVEQYRRGEQISSALDKLRDLMSAELRHTGDDEMAGTIA